MHEKTFITQLMMKTVLILLFVAKIEIIHGIIAKPPKIKKEKNVTNPL